MTFVLTCCGLNVVWDDQRDHRCRVPIWTFGQSGTYRRFGSYWLFSTDSDLSRIRVLFEMYDIGLFSNPSESSTIGTFPVLSMPAEVDGFRHPPVCSFRQQCGNSGVSRRIAKYANFGTLREMAITA